MTETAEPKHWTYEDYVRLPDDGKRYEIVKGERIVCPSPSWKHQCAAMSLSQRLDSYAAERGLGRCVCAPMDVVLANDVVLQPDILFVSTERLGIAGPRAVTASPDLVIEILSESTRKHDYVVKRQLYAEHGVREFWIVDPDLERVEQFVLEGNQLALKGEVTSGELKSLVVLPGLTMKLADLFR